jgi:hypothetical protein
LLNALGKDLNINFKCSELKFSENLKEFICLRDYSYCKNIDCEIKKIKELKILKDNDIFKFKGLKWEIYKDKFDVLQIEVSNPGSTQFQILAKTVNDRPTYMSCGNPLCDTSLEIPAQILGYLMEKPLLCCNCIDSGYINE